MVAEVEVGSRTDKTDLNNRREAVIEVVAEVEEAVAVISMRRAKINPHRHKARKID